MVAPAARSRRAFTLLELILVLSVAALMLGVAAAALVRSESDQARARRGVSELVMILRTARADAMVLRRAVSVEVEAGPVEAAPGGGRVGEMTVRRTERDPVRVDAGNLGLLDASGAWTPSVRVEFDASGRCGARRWVLAERTGAQAGRIAWTITFDPVSGEARSVAGEAGAPGAIAEDRIVTEQSR